MTEGYQGFRYSGSAFSCYFLLFVIQYSLFFILLTRLAKLWRSEFIPILLILLKFSKARPSSPASALGRIFLQHLL